MAVMPERKGAKLKSDADDGEDDAENAGDENLDRDLAEAAKEADTATGEVATEST
jgi:tRNA (guanine9-N1)-methyltransferase